MSAERSGIDVTDRRRLRLGVAAVRVPAAFTGPLTEVDRVLGEINAYWETVESEAAALKERARQEGYEAGRLEAMGELASSLAAAHQEAAEFARRSETRIVSIALGALRKILPDLARDDVVAQLAVDAVRTGYADPGTTVYVHPDAVPAVRARLAEWAREHEARRAPHVAADADLAHEDVVVESVSGTVRAGLSERVDAVEGVLRGTAAAIDGR